MSNSDAGQYEKFVESFTFREAGSLTIPVKKIDGSLGSDYAYHLADVVIESTTSTRYENYKSRPAHSFYGYASLVSDDCLEIKIPLEFPRQRIYEGRITEAFQAWNNLAFWLNTQKPFLELVNQLDVEPEQRTVNICDIDPFPFSWKSLPLREVYVRCTPRTQFRIELFWVEPLYFEDGCGNGHGGESQEETTDKQDGLPNGIQPKQNPNNDPYQGNPPLNEPEVNSPYYNDKEDDTLDDVFGSNDMREFNLSWQWMTKNQSCVNITSSVATRTFVATDANQIQIELGDLAANTCGVSLRFMRILVAGVAVDERAGNGNAAFSLLNVSVVEA